MTLKVNDILHEVDMMRPNAVDAALKLKFLNEIEAEVFDLSLEFMPAEEVLKNNIESRAYFLGKAPAGNDENAGIGENETFNSTDIGDPLNLGKKKQRIRKVWKFIPYGVTDGNAVMLLDDRFSGVYTSYVKAKIDYLEDETENYVNDAGMHTAEKDAWLSWMTRTHEHRQPELKGLL